MILIGILKSSLSQ